MMDSDSKMVYFAFACVLSAGIGAGGMYLENKDKIELGNKCGIILECEDILAEGNVPKPEINEAELANGYLASYDKYTFYVNNERNKIEETVNYINALPTALGMGFTVDFNDDGCVCFSEIRADSEAEKQGLMTGDKIISVNGVSLDENGVETAKNIRGKEGTTFSIVVERNGRQKELEITRHNAEVKIVNTLNSKKIDDVLYIKIDNVVEGTNMVLNQALSENDFESVIIDLRNNPGGETGTGVMIADRFVSEGNVILHYYTEKMETFYCYANDDDCFVPIVVLINEHTASAAEIITSLLKQYSNATLVGTNTLGKGIFQINEKLESGGMFRYTAGYYTVGDWECYQDVGIAPDVEVEMEYDEDVIGTEDDIQLQKALEILQK